MFAFKNFVAAAQQGPVSLQDFRCAFPVTPQQVIGNARERCRLPAQCPARRLPRREARVGVGDQQVASDPRVAERPGRRFAVVADEGLRYDADRERLVEYPLAVVVIFAVVVE